MRKILYLFAFKLLCFTCVFSGYCQNYPVVEKLNTGSIDWTNRTITASGINSHTKTKITEDGKSQLFKKAKIKASKNLFTTMGSIQIKSEKKLDDFIASRQDLLKQIQLMINNAKVIKKEYRPNGSAEIILQLNLDKGLAQLILPEEIVQIEPIKTFAKQPQKGQNSEYTGIVIDARGLKITPVMSPKILDENNKEVYGPAFISREYAVQHGTVQYVHKMTENERIGSKPIVVTGLKSSPKSNSDIIISTADSSKLHSSSHNLDLFHQGRVVIVIDNRKQ